jgi:hypothetical protein
MGEVEKFTKQNMRTAHKTTDCFITLKSGKCLGKAPTVKNLECFFNMTLHATFKFKFD